MSYTVSARLAEFGLRVALGARPVDIIRLVLGEGLRLVGPGAGAGTALAFAGSRLLRASLFGVQPSDAVTFLVVPVTVTVVATAATYRAARRATVMDPVRAMGLEL
jgi:putative ABC transport system permease protein